MRADINQKPPHINPGYAPATPLAQCFIELLRETAANRGFLRTDLETILLFHRATPRDGSESRLFEDRSRDNLTEFLFWRSRLLSSLSSESFGMTRYEYLRLNHESKRFDLLIIATRPSLGVLFAVRHTFPNKELHSAMSFFKASCDPGTLFLSYSDYKPVSTSYTMA